MKFYNDHDFNKFLTQSLSTLSSFNIFEHIESQNEDRTSKKEREIERKRMDRIFVY